MNRTINRCRWCKKIGFFSSFQRDGALCSACWRTLREKQALIDRDQQRVLWRNALVNMPWMAGYKLKGGGYVFRGVATALRMCLGYHCYSATGRNNAQAAIYNALCRGTVPKGDARQRMLRALAGPHGATVARARLIQLGQAYRFKHWVK